MTASPSWHFDAVRLHCRLLGTGKSLLFVRPHNPPFCAAFPPSYMPDTSLKACAYLGGCNYPIAAGDSATLSFGSEVLLIRLTDGTSFSVPYIELASIEVSGPGTLTSGGGFIGGGFGVESALEGMAIAAVLNALTTKSKIHTFVSLTTNIGELHFHYGAMEPGALRIALASVHTTLRRLDPRWRQERVATLQSAQTQGALSEPEFARLTQRLSETTVEVSVPPPANPKSVPPPTNPKNVSPPTNPKNLPPPPIVGPKGRCPNCGATLSLHAEECFSCRAIFGIGSAWKVVPLC